MMMMMMIKEPESQKEHENWEQNYVLKQSFSLCVTYYISNGGRYSVTSMFVFLLLC